MKKLLLLPALVVVIWAGIALYWQTRIARSLRTLETSDYFSYQSCWNETVPGRRAAGELLDAGIRALPALVRSMTPEKSAAYHTEASLLIRQIATRASGISWTEMNPYAIEMETPPTERARKCRLIQGWWLENEGGIRSAWRPWERGYRLE